MILLGSTGSIGINTLEVARTFCINVESLSAGRNITLLNSQIKEFLPKNVCIADPKDEARLDCQFLKKHNIRLYTGDNGLLELIAESESHLVVNALVGYAGLAPSLQAQRYKKKLALANKESLVVAGWLLEDYELVPVDSEHFGLWYLLRHAPLSKNIKQLFLTASGGALRDMPLENMYDA
ncbi:MAG: 1-deoxy-D-xylulose-5-phosphate reductoisomerase, partial [Helicobacter sp.]|nr:1-deoxy-D-xylulose-5-phosphate reductoisomerase [Helicobacter sp.]MDY5739903.1 1-deoxy-D-xylulose-5-phosphate reductoisomerase [Helicobacter sp.]